MDRRLCEPRDSGKFAIFATFWPTLFTNNVQIHNEKSFLEVKSPKNGVSAAKEERDLQVRGAMDAVQHELERQARQTVPVGSR